ncbi:xanthine dehydrogenase family protein molybdopterin-binding subunit [Novosphingobium resinovorum]|uniref:xanthine dehydrogenase family protein molybdopterin-binding subunit n=1 Tax=Novosphingobium resinovorum TaxID=158500 RepID=UPI002ED51365|nr:molybdopterin cofactor-binding domain-containing protein [Novosphingobium resinovorum]
MIRADRRQVLSGTGALLVAALLPLPGRVRAAALSRNFEPNAFVRIDADGLVTVVIKAVEFGQGAATGLATLVAEELDADWDKVRFEFAPNDDKRYANLRMGTMAVGGSTTMASAWLQMRKAGAAARAMLVDAAAARWGVAAAQISTERGVAQAGRHRAHYGELALAAARLPVPEDPPLKSPERFRLIGKVAPRRDSACKSDGSARFAMDVRHDGMVHAVMAHPPAFGARMATYDAAAALAVPGVRKVAPADAGVAVYADSMAAALGGRKALAVTWDHTGAETRDSQALEAEALRLAALPGFAVVDTGPFPATLPTGARVVEGQFVLPYLAHAPMEPLNATLRLRDGRLDVWAGSQFQVLEPAAMAEELGVAADKVTLHQCYAGGSFGRRATPGREFGHQAGKVCAAWGGPEAVKFLWTREDDLTGGFYRPMMVHKVRAAIGADGTILGWDHRMAGQSIVAGTPFEAGARKRGYDKLMVEGADEIGYRVPARRLGVSELPSRIPVNWWRSVGASHTGYVVEAMIDRLLAGVGIDLVQGRLALMEDERGRTVVRRAAEIAGWSGPRREGRALGFAYVKSFGTYVAQVAEVSRGKDGSPRVHKVWCAVDCGLPINPDNIRAQVEGGIGFAVGHALHAEIVLGEGGRVMQTNFDRYPSLRIGDMPEVEVAIIASGADPSGIGEPPVPPLAPAIASAWRQLTGMAIERLPFARAIREARA